MFYKQPAASATLSGTGLRALPIGRAWLTAESAELDYMCRSGVQSFFMPCTNHHEPDYAFFETRGVKERDLGDARLIL